MPGKGGQLIKILLVNLLIVSAGIIPLELVFGNWLKENNINKLNIIKDSTFTFEIGSLYESPFTTTRYTRDRYGLRGRFQRPEQITILTVGGSTTDQRYITDGETWQDVLQDEFKADGKDVVVANAGIDGQSTFGHIKDFEWWFPHIPGLKPKYVLFYVGLNDFYLDEGGGSDALVKENSERSLRQLLRDKSAVYHVLQTLYGVYVAEIKQKIGHRSLRFSELSWTTKPLQDTYDGIMATRLREYGERLEVLIDKTRRFGATPIFVTQPSHKHRYRDGRLEGIEETIVYKGAPVNGVDYFLMMRKVDEVTMSVSLRHQVLCIDLAQERTWEDEDFYDFRHMTPKGAMKVGKSLFSSLKSVL